MGKIAFCAGPVAALGLMATPANADTISFGATLDVACIFVVTDGTLAPNADYTSLSSENTGGSAAQVVLTALGGTPMVSFSTPNVSGSGDVSGVTPQVRYTSLDGANQAYTSAASSSSASDLADTYTVHAKIEDAGGFDAGDYTVTTVVTCSG